MTEKPLSDKAHPSLFLVLFLAAFGFALRTHRLDAQSLWLDEGLSVIFARPDLATMLPQLIVRDIHPPLYEVLLHFWMQLAGDSEFSVRFLSVIFGVMLVPAVFRLGVELFRGDEDDGREALVAGLLAGALVAVSPFLVYYSQEARNYIVVTFWSVTATYALWRALKAGKRRMWLGYSLAAALTVYSHYYGVFVLAFHFVYLVLTWRQQRGRWRAWFLSMVGAALLFLPWLMGFWGQFQNLWLHPDYWPGTIDFLTMTVRTFGSFIAGSSGALGSLGPVLALFGLLLVAGFAVLLFRGGLNVSRGEVYAVLYAVVPLLAVYAITARNPKFAERYLIMISPAFYLLLARGLAALYGLSIRQGSTVRWLKSTSAAFCLLGSVAVLGFSTNGAVDVLYGAAGVKDDHRGAISYIEANARPGDKVLLVRNTYHTFEYYYDGDLPWEGFDPSGNGDVSLGHVSDRLNQIVPGNKRIWLLLWQENVVDPTQTVSGLLGKFCNEVPVPQQFTGVELKLYEVPDDVSFSPQPSQALTVEYENGVRLLGFDQARATAKPGEKVEIAFYWQPKRQIAEEFSVSLALLDARGLTWNAEGQPASGHYRPPTRWEPEGVVRGRVAVTVPPGTPPGRYSLELNLFDKATLKELSRVEENGQPVGTRLIVTEVEVLPDEVEPPPGLAELGVGNELGVDIPGEHGEPVVRVLGSSPLPESVAQGSVVDISLFWEKVGIQSEDHEMSLDLVGEETRNLVTGPLVEQYPTSLWPKGRRLQSRLRFTVPANVAAGDYELVLTVRQKDGATAGTTSGGTAVNLGAVAVTGRERVLEPPPVTFVDDAVYGNLARLYGYDVGEGEGKTVQLQAGEEVSVRLVWQAIGETDVPYKVFVHLVDAEGRIRGQHDSQPALDSRPTTGWVSGEYVVDTHPIRLGADSPPGRYTILVGLYGPDGARLPVRDAAGVSRPDAMPLVGPVIEVGP